MLIKRKRRLASEEQIKAWWYDGYHSTLEWLVAFHCEALRLKAEARKHAIEKLP